MNFVFANRAEESEIYPLTVREIAEAQKDDTSMERLAKKRKYSTQLVEDTKVLCRETSLLSPRHSNIVQFNGIIIICNTLDIHDLKRLFELRCTGKVCAILSGHMSKSAEAVK